MRSTLETTTTYDLYVGVWNPAKENHTPMLVESFETAAEAKREGRKMHYGPWWVVQCVQKVVASSDTVAA